MAFCDHFPRAPRTTAHDSVKWLAGPPRKVAKPQLDLTRIRTIIQSVGPRPLYRLRFAPEVVAHLQAIDGKYHSFVRSSIRIRLTADPVKATRNRKPLEPPAPFSATWELRFGPNNRFRVFYDVDEEDRRVDVLAIGVKDRERLFVAGQEYLP